MVPALLIRWLNDPAASGYHLGSVRVIQSGGQRLQPETRQRTQKVFGHVTVQENFGMSEGLLMFVRLDDPPPVRLETVGRPVCPDDEVRLVGEDGTDVADGRIGEMWARGPYTIRGYYNAPEHNERAFSADGFYRSGDLMWRHPTGNYVVAGRTKDLINRGGEKISAEEVENLILGHPAVVNAACVPVPDPVLGERMCACVILRPGHRLALGGAHRLPGRAGDRPAQAARAAGRPGSLPAVPGRKGLKENPGRSGRRVSGYGGERAAMRRIDLHAYPGTAEWIASQGPYAEPLSRYWKKPWMARGEEDVVADFRAHRIEAVLVAFDVESVTGAPPCTSDYVAGLRDRYPDTFVQAWGTVDPLRGNQAVEEAERAVTELGVLGFHFHPIMGHYVRPVGQEVAP